MNNEKQTFSILFFFLRLWVFFGSCYAFELIEVERKCAMHKCKSVSLLAKLSKSRVYLLKAGRSRLSFSINDISFVRGKTILEWIGGTRFFTGKNIPRFKTGSNQGTMHRTAVLNSHSGSVDTKFITVWWIVSWLDPV